MHAVCEEDESGPLWNSSLCLMGSLADVHLDCCGITQLVVNIQCNQLWLLWPATAHNLSWWSIHVQSSHEISTVDAINGMCGLEMLYAKEPQAFILPPYHFHAVITFDTSIHAKVSLWGFRGWRAIASPRSPRFAQLRCDGEQHGFLDVFRDRRAFAVVLFSAGGRTADGT